LAAGKRAKEPAAEGISVKIGVGGVNEAELPWHGTVIRNRSLRLVCGNGNRNWNVPGNSLVDTRCILWTTHSAGNKVSLLDMMRPKVRNHDQPPTSATGRYQ